MTDLAYILNWRRINSRLTTSGQPSAAQLKQIQHLGVTSIINLGAHDDPNALPNEADIVASLGMNYV